jgi:hypothetical protein
VKPKLPVPGTVHDNPPDRGSAEKFLEVYPPDNVGAKTSKSLQRFLPSIPILADRADADSLSLDMTQTTVRE